MKFHHQLLIIGVIALALFVAKDDVKVAYNKATTYFAKNVDTIDLKDNIKDNIIITTEKVAKVAKAITPGALKADSLANNNLDVVSNPNDALLSVKGVIDWTNTNRANNGNLPPLKENSKLSLSAQKKLDDMFDKQYFEHVSPSGVGVSDLGNKVGYKYIIIGENLALGNFKNNKALLDAWMASPGHRANILNAKYQEIGVAVGHGMYNGRDTWLAVQHFGLPSAICPPIDEVLHSSISLQENNIKTLEADLNVRKQRIDSGAVYEGKTTNEQISDYNKLVVNYNQLIAVLKTKINQYNTGVRAFNACLNTNTATQTTHS